MYQNQVILTAERQTSQCSWTESYTLDFQPPNDRYYFNSPHQFGLNGNGWSNRFWIESETHEIPVEDDEGMNNEH